MIPTVINVKRKQGDTYPLIFEISYNGELISFSGWQFTLLVKDYIDSDTYIINKTVVCPEDAPLGQVYFPFTEEEVAIEGEFDYEVKLIDPEGRKVTPIEGIISFDRSL